MPRLNVPAGHSVSSAGSGGGIQQTAQRAKVQIEVLVAQPERLLELLHAVRQRHQSQAEALDRLVVEPPGLYPAQRLPLHQLAQQLDDGQNELGETLLDGVGIGGDAVPPRLERRTGERADHRWALSTRKASW